MRRTPGWNPWLPWTVAAATAVAVLALALAWRRARGAAAGPGGQAERAAGPTRGRLFAAAGVAGLIAVLAGPAAYAMTPLSQPIAGSNPVAGPTAGGAAGGFAGGLAGLAGGPAGLAGGAGRSGGGLGGAASQQMIAYLEAHRDGATWLVAVQGSSAAASIILQTGGIPVMAMGGFRGTDPAPTLTQIEQYVKQGKLHYVLAGARGGFGGGGFGRGGFGGGSGTAGGGGTTSVLSWVEQNCTAVPASAYSSSANSGAVTGTGGLYRCG